MSNILVTLDSILDTRYSLLEYFNYKITAKEYLQRDSDYFPYLGLPYQSLYSRRDKRLLKRANYTPIRDLITMLIVDIKSESFTLEPGEDIVITVNLYPYNFSKIEEEAIRNSLIKYFKREIFIINRRLVKSDLPKYRIIVDYSGLEFLDRLGMSEDLLPFNGITTMLVVPDLFGDNNILKREKDKEDFLRAMSDTLSILLKVEFASRVLFCREFKEEKKDND